VLRNGNHVEIITSPTARPLPSWLNYVVTSKARSSIRGFLKHQEDEEALELGRQLLEKSLQNLGYPHERIPTEDKIELLKKLRLQDWTELLQDIGFGRRLPNIVAQQVLAKEEHITEELWASATSAYEIQMQLRLIHQLNQIEEGQLPDNYIDPSLLSDLERRMLKDSFEVIERLHNVLKTIFPVA